MQIELQAKSFILGKERGRIWNRVFSTTRAQHSKCHDIRYDTTFHTGGNQWKSFLSNLFQFNV